FFGSVFPGGQLAVGPGYRTQYGDSGTVDVHGAWSIRNYLAADATVMLPKLAAGRMVVALNGNWLRAPEVDFFGVGKASREADRSTFPYRTTTVGTTATIQPMRFLRAGGGIDYLDIVTTSSEASIDRTFT